ncbi:peroxisome assembly protein 12 [Helicoverpa armigera]|uniref:peroxisome assembly protein 12 n=1 Tax=Helicoverpa armigera TaxID=29058 RepID=UPI0030831B1C
MAVYAAHLTRTLQGTPTVFQVTAQEALGATVKPALRKVAEYLAAVYPDKCGWCVRWYDEVFLLFDSCLQYYYLKHYAASFSESFYDLIRVPTSSSNEFSSGQQLPVYLERASLVLLVLLPYLKDKLEALVERWREDDEDGRLGKSTQDRLRRAATRVYMIAQSAWYCTRLVQLARYTRGRSAAHSPALCALGVALRPAPTREPSEHTWGDLLTSVATGDISSAAECLPLLGGAMLRCVEYGAFGVQFLRWWEAAAAPQQVLPVPPPPKRDERSARFRNKCPVCLQTWKIPTVLPVSGYIFCYSCISKHLRSHSACPLTRLPAAETDLVRLYLD